MVDRGSHEDGQRQQRYLRGARARGRWPACTFKQPHTPWLLTKQNGLRVERRDPLDHRHGLLHQRRLGRARRPGRWHGRGALELQGRPLRLPAPRQRPARGPCADGADRREGRSRALQRRPAQRARQRRRGCLAQAQGRARGSAQRASRSQVCGAQPAGREQPQPVRVHPRAPRRSDRRRGRRVPVGHPRCGRATSPPCAGTLSDPAQPSAARAFAHQPAPLAPPRSQGPRSSRTCARRSGRRA